MRYQKKKQKNKKPSNSLDFFRCCLSREMIRFVWMNIEQPGDPARRNHSLERCCLSYAITNIRD